MQAIHLIGHLGYNSLQDTVHKIMLSTYKAQQSNSMSGKSLIIVEQGNEETILYSYLAINWTCIEENI